MSVVAQATNDLEKPDAERQPVSAFIVCCNEEEHIGACLDSLKFCDEVVVIDSFSTDKTVDICENFGARVIQREWPGYREQKAYGLSQCSNEWVINLDADERVTEELRDNILRVLFLENQSDRSEGRPDAYELNRVVFFLGRWWRRGGWYPEYRTRFFRKSRVTWGGTDPHEKPVVDGVVGRLDGELSHYTYKDIDDQLERLHRYSGIAAREDYARGRRVGILGICLSPLVRSFKFFVLKRGYREGMAGFIVAVLEGYYTFLKYAKLWEFQHRTTIRERSTNGR